MTVHQTRRGQTLVSFAITLPFAALAAGGVLFALLALAARTALDLETYALARAHLYGNALGRCAPARFWAEGGERLAVRHRCPSAGAAEGTLAWRGRTLFRSRVDLLRGDFGR